MARAGSLQTPPPPYATFQARIAEKLHEAKRRRLLAKPELAKRFLTVTEVKAAPNHQPPSSQLTAADSHPIATLIDALNELQQLLITLADAILATSRLLLLVVIFQNSLNFVMMAYSLVRYSLKYNDGAGGGDLKIGPLMAVLFYGYQLFISSLENLIVVVAFDMVYRSILDTGCKMNLLNNYVREDSIKLRLAQFVRFTRTNMHPFSVCGLFNLDGSLLFMIVSGTTTYIILLIQFDDNK